MRHKLILSTSELRHLLELTHTGAWVLTGGTVENEKTEDHRAWDRMLQKILALTKGTELDSLVEVNERDGSLLPSPELDEDPRLKETIDDYEEEAFWHHLAWDLGERDFFREHTKEQVMAMSREESYLTRGRYSDRYAEEFENYGIARLELMEQEQEQ